MISRSQCIALPISRHPLCLNVNLFDQLMKINKIILILFASIIISCNDSELKYDYSKRIGTGANFVPVAGLTEVQIKIVNGLTKSEVPGSISTPFSIDGEIVKGVIPDNHHVKNIKLRLHHDWTDPLTKDNAVLTLRFTHDGQLYDIVEFQRILP